MFKKLLTALAVSATLLLPVVAQATILFPTGGGTGSSTLTGILIGNGVSPVNTLTVGSGLTLTGTTLTSTGGGSSTFGTTSIFATTPLQWNTTTATLSILQAGTSQNGYLSSTDWNTFNGKQAAGNYLTALTGDGTASGPGSVAFTLATVNSNVGTFNNLTVNAKGLVTAASNIAYDTFGYLFPGNATTTNITFSGGLTGNLTGNADTATKLTTGRTISITGDLAYTSPSFDGTGNVTAAGTLATVNTNVGSFTNANITVNGKGLVTAASNGTAADTFAWPFTPTTYGNATSSTLGFTLGFLSVGSSTIVGNATTTGMHAFGSVRIPSLGVAAGTFLAVDPNGVVIATSTPSGSNSAFSPSANYATATALPSNTYLAGVITAVANGALSVDGANPSVGQRVLVKNESTAANNGLYDVTAAGSAIAAFVLTRDAQYNSSSNIIPGIITYVISGSTNDDDFWAMTSAAPITVGTTALNYTEVSGGGAAVTSVSNSDSTLTISPTAGAVVASLNLGHANTWSVLQNFTNATSSLFSATYASTTQLIVSGQSGCAQFAAGVLTGTGSNCSAGGSTFGQTFEIDALNWLTPTTSIGINAPVSGTTYGFGIGDQLLGYASSTNKATIFGLSAGGTNATTSASTRFETAIGYQALEDETTGSSNTALGFQAGQIITSGGTNTAIGEATLAAVTSSIGNTAVGAGAMEFDNPAQSVAIGAGSDQSDTGSNNISIGYHAANTGQQSSDNVIIGKNAGLNSTGGSGQNVVIGSNAGGTIFTTGAQNTILGSFAGNNLTSGSGNVVIGATINAPSATAANTLDIQNILFGTSATLAGGSGQIGIGSSSPFARFAIQANNNDTNISLFNIGSSTQSATTTLFNISNTGAITTQLGNALVLSGGANTALSAYGGAAGCTNQVVTALSAVGATTCTSLTAAMFGSVTANTVFGNFTGASAAPTFTATSSLFTFGNGIANTANVISLASISQGWLGNVGSASAIPISNATTTLFSGTTGQNTYFTASGALMGTSSIFTATNTNIGISTTTPWAQLSVSALNPSSAFNPLFALASSTSTTLNTTVFSVLAGGQITLGESLPATSTTIQINWATTPRQVDEQIGFSATSINIINATTTQFAASTKIVYVCNPNGVAGAITWGGVEWLGGTVPTQTTTSNQCDVYSFDVTHATSTTLYKVAGTQGSGFQ